MKTTLAVLALFVSFLAGCGNTEAKKVLSVGEQITDYERSASEFEKKATETESKLNSFVDKKEKEFAVEQAGIEFIKISQRNGGKVSVSPECLDKRLTYNKTRFVSDREAIAKEITLYRNTAINYRELVEKLRKIDSISPK